MGYTLRNTGASLGFFLLFLALSAAALCAAWWMGRPWGDLSSRRRNGEALTEEELSRLKRSRKLFCLWAGASLLLTAAAFLCLTV